MLTELQKLIARLQRGIDRNASFLKTIRNPHLLVNSLQELHNLIGNDKVKDSVATQISHLIMLKRRALQNPCIKEDSVMLNTVLYGPPGTGKTLIGTKLAKIWYSLGYLDGSRSAKEKKHEIGEVIKDLFKDNGMPSTSENETAITLCVMLLIVTIFITLLAMSWSMYNKLGAAWTAGIVSGLALLILGTGCYINSSLSTPEEEPVKPKDNKNCNGPICIGSKSKELTDKNEVPDESKLQQPTIYYDVPSDDQIIKVVTRGDFVDRYVGWTTEKTNKLLEANLGKVVFVDEAYSLINGPHDEFGMEALTTINLFLSQHPNEIIIIFAGYKDLLDDGPYAVQPGLKRRFMWQFNCSGYTTDQLYEIFKMQLGNKGWAISNEKEAKEIFKQNRDAFQAFGGDTEKAAFFSELEHSREFMENEKGLRMNVLEPIHIRKGIQKLRENSIESSEESTNPLANMMRLMSGKNKRNGNSDEDLIRDIRKHSAEFAYH
jgi:hypothetical protein